MRRDALSRVRAERHTGWMPQRFQLSRRRGWRKPADAVVVARPSSWGNPFRIGIEAPTREEAVARYRDWVQSDAPDAVAVRARARAELRGRDLGCWCDLEGMCHADVLLEVANADAAEDR